MASVVAVEFESVPKSVVKLTCSLAAGSPSRYILAIIVEFVLEFAKIVSGDAETPKVPSTMFTVVELDSPSQVAVTLAVAGSVDGESVTVAIPLEFVIADEGNRVPKSVVKPTWALATGFPPRYILAVIVEVIVESAGMVAGDAET